MDLRPGLGHTPTCLVGIPVCLPGFVAQKPGYGCHPSKHACTAVSVMKRYRLPVLTSTVTVPACQYTVPIQHRNGTACTLGLYRNGTAAVFKRYKDGTVSVLVVPVYGSGGTKTVQFLD